MSAEPITDERRAAGYGTSRTPTEPHCVRCGNKLADYVFEPARIRCVGCKTVNLFGDAYVGDVERKVGRAR